MFNITLCDERVFPFKEYNFQIKMFLLFKKPHILSGVIVVKATSERLGGFPSGSVCGHHPLEHMSSSIHRLY